LTDPKQWRDLGYCLAQLSYTEKGLRKIIDLFPKYQKALSEHEVVEHFRTIIVKVIYFPADTKEYFLISEGSLVLCRNLVSEVRYCLFLC
jgi:hypothetical protein